MHRVLIPLDGTEASYDVIDAVISLFGPERAQISLLVSRPDMFAGAPEDTVELLEEEVTHGIIATTHHLHEVEYEGLRRCRAHGLEPELIEAHSKPYDAIMQNAENHDVLAMHELDRRRFTADIHGSRGGKIARQAPCHVLLINTSRKAPKAG